MEQKLRDAWDQYALGRFGNATKEEYDAALEAFEAGYLAGAADAQETKAMEPADERQRTLRWINEELEHLGVIVLEWRSDSRWDTSEDTYYQAMMLVPNRLSDSAGESR